MSLLKKITYIVITGISVSTAAAQNGHADHDYVILTAGDTLVCEITSPIIGGPRYRPTPTSGTIALKPQEVKEYYISDKNKLYQSVIHSGQKKPVFLTVIEQGKISLYEEIQQRQYYNMNPVSPAMSFTSSSSTYWYVSKGSNVVEKLKASDILAFGKKKRKDLFGEMLSDNKDLYDKFMAEDKFTFKQIREYVRLYNAGQPLRN